MPPSQLKRLKASLREQGITGPQKSKKEKKNQKNSGADARAKKASALSAIREAANPFDFKHLSRPKKFEYTTNRTEDASKVLGRPGVTKSQGEEARRKTLLLEMNKRNKVGGILDRRIGENDPSMTLDDRMMARFEQEQQRKRGNVFDLEDDEDEVMLTHGGKSLDFDLAGQEDYDAGSVSGDSVGDADGFLQRKRRRDDDEEVDNADEPKEDEPDRKKSKAEVMKEVIAKSKMHKYERQQQKEDDDELREELDKDLPDILAALRGHISKKDQPPPPPVKDAPKDAPRDDFSINPERAALLAGKSRAEVDKEYDIRRRQMLSDQKAKPTSRTLTEEEKAKEEADQLKELEERRQKRMRGEADDDSDAEANDKKGVEEAEDEEDEEQDDAAEFGLAQKPGRRPEGFEDEEDDFIFDDVESGSELKGSGSEESDSDIDDTMGMEDEDEEFLAVLKDPSTKAKTQNGTVASEGDAKASTLPYTYSCPRSLDEVLVLFGKVQEDDIPKVVQRIRAQYHPGLHSDNKHKLTDFACALVDWIAQPQLAVSLAVQESVIRHIHSLNRSYSIAIGTRFRENLKRLAAKSLSEVTPGDLCLLTAIGSIYETSAHFEQVSTPAITIMARWMGLLNTVSTAQEVSITAYLAALSLHYQRVSKRYLPEIVRSTVLCLKSDSIEKDTLAAHCKNISTMVDTWSKLPAFIEIMTPLLDPLALHKSQAAPTLQRVRIAIQTARLRRRPQELHHHRPLPIKSSIPKFEEAFDPNKHYDPDRERADATKLRKEYKRERKGALRELRKDANFIAREKLRDKKEKDRAYEEKYKRLVAEIQGEEGREAKAYEREKKARKRSS